MGWLISTESISKKPWVATVNAAHRRRMRNSLFCDSVTYTDREAEAERAGEKRGRKGRESGENKCERKILNDQNSSHKTLGLRPCILLGADEALQLCQLPSMLHHENTLKPRREVLNSRRDPSSIKPCILLFCTVCVLIFPTIHSTYVALQVFRLKDPRQ